MGYEQNRNTDEICIANVETDFTAISGIKSKIRHENTPLLFYVYAMYILCCFPIVDMTLENKVYYYYYSQ